MRKRLSRIVRCWVQYVKTSEPLQALSQGKLEDLPLPLEFFVVPAVGVGFAIAGKVGILGAVSGIAAKASLDGWNVFANIALPGAILKY